MHIEEHREEEEEGVDGGEEEEDEQEDEEEAVDFDDIDSKITEAVESLQVNVAVGKFYYIGCNSKLSLTLAK